VGKIAGNGRRTLLRIDAQPLKMEIHAAPAEFLCPITYEVMTDPVIVGDGHTYERSAIEEWLKTRTTSPITNRRIDAASIAPNYALRGAIERWKAGQGVADTVTVAAAPPPAPPRSFRIKGGRIECRETEPVETAILAVIDRSGSMGWGASPAASTGAPVEGRLFSRLDLVKHSLKTVVGMLGDQGGATALGIVSFSNSGSVELPLRPIDGPGKVEAERIIDGLYADGGTNIWDGLRLALDQAKAYVRQRPHANVHVMLLTDGEPTADYIPLQGIPVALKRKMGTLGVPVTVSSFGFGYSLDSKLLEAICREGGGTYGYIPDCSMVGTIFINYCAAALSTVAAHVRVGEVLVGALQAGMGRAVSGGGATTTVVTYGNCATQGTVEVEGTAEGAEAFRQALIACLRDCTATGAWDASYADKLRAVAATAAGASPFVAAALEDIQHADAHKGQLLKAVSTESWFKSWGLNHLLAYVRALECEQCINFKDAALQTFAAPAFQALQEIGNGVFENLPTPVPSMGIPYGSGITLSTIRMGNLNVAAGPCWDQWTELRVADGRFMHAKDVRAGDEMWGGYKVLAVIKTVVMSLAPMVRLGRGALMTPWHPVRRRDTGEGWQFPAEVEGAAKRSELVEYYYNLVLDRGHVVQLTGGWETCTMGHGFADGPVITHPYFGTGAVLEDLKKQRGWSEGLVVLEGARFVRDEATGLVCGLR
jgi:Mg-chelatase subunit ChlD